MRSERKTRRVLDKIDANILRLLQANARAQMKDIAEEVGLTPAPCIDRVRQLEKQEIITGYHARVDPAALGLNLLVFIEITLTDKSGDHVAKFKREISGIPQILECHWVSGSYDFLVKARLPDIGDYRDLLQEILMKLQGVKQVNSAVVIEEMKNAVGLPVDLSNILDETR
jgi:Lrp/AsnC family transcriptional regulator, leucine-responsive regulatory protein